MVENERLRECPLCGAIGLEERIDEHDCPTFLKRNERAEADSALVSSRSCVVADPKQVLDGYPLSIAETISCPGCRYVLSEGKNIVVLAYRPHWTEIWAIKTVRCRSCGSDSIRSMTHPGEYLITAGRITSRSDATTQTNALVFSAPTVHDHLTLGTVPSERSELHPTIRRCVGELSSTKETSTR